MPVRKSCLPFRINHEYTNGLIKNGDVIRLHMRIGSLPSERTSLAEPCAVVSVGGENSSSEQPAWKDIQTPLVSLWHAHCHTPWRSPNICLKEIVLMAWSCTESSVEEGKGRKFLVPLVTLSPKAGLGEKTFFIGRICKDLCGKEQAHSRVRIWGHGRTIALCRQQRLVPTVTGGAGDWQGLGKGQYSHIHSFTHSLSHTQHKQDSKDVTTCIESVSMRREMYKHCVTLHVEGKEQMRSLTAEVLWSITLLWFDQDGQ